MQQELPSSWLTSLSPHLKSNMIKFNPFPHVVARKQHKSFIWYSVQIASNLNSDDLAYKASDNNIDVVLSTIFMWYLRWNMTNENIFQQVRSPKIW